MLTTGYRMLDEILPLALWWHSELFFFSLRLLVIVIVSH